MRGARMSELSFSSARSDIEADQALDLAVRTFRQNRSDPNYLEFKTLLWREDPSYRVENLLLAKAPTGRIVGLIRLVPRILRRADETYAVAGISSVCLDSEFQGRGLSSSFMRYALDEARDRSYDLCLLMARRAADHYYTRFGFWGISSYNRVTFSAQEEGGDEDERISLAESAPEHVSVYADAYLTSYRGSFGCFARTPEYWRFLLKKIAHFQDTKWLTLFVGNRPVGYVIHSDAVIHEVAYLDGVSPVALLKALRTVAQLEANGQTTILAEIPPQHRLLAEVPGVETWLTFRECNYGGHMVRILNLQRVADALAARVHARLRQLGSTQYVEKCGGIHITFDGSNCEIHMPLSDATLSFEQTCWLLGVKTLSLPNTTVDLQLPFNVSLPDQL